MGDFILDYFFPIFVFFFVLLVAVAVAVSGYPSADGPVVSRYARTIEHDGHRFVIARGGSGSGIVHHPSCTCLLKPAEKE